MKPASYELTLWSSVLATQRYLYTLTDKAMQWKRSIRAQGGSWEGSFELEGSKTLLLDAFDTWLGCDLRERSEGVLSWRGMIREIDLVHGGSRWRRSLDTLSNYVTTTYIEPGEDGQVTSSAAASHARSIARYGQKEEILLQDNLPRPAAEAMRDRHLTARAWPNPLPVSMGAGDDFYLELSAAGYAYPMQWRFTTQTTEYTTEQETGNKIRFDKESGAPVLVDEGRTGGGGPADFQTWQTTSGSAVYSAWATSTESDLYWGYCGAAVEITGLNPEVPGNYFGMLIYQDQALTTPGWLDRSGNAADPKALGKGLKGYYIRGPASDWINDIVTTDCPFVSVGAIDQNLLQVSRLLSNSTRCWDAIMDIVELGDTAGNPWRCWVDTDRLVHYKQIDVTPRYYKRGSGFYDSASGRVQVNPWLMQPGVVRDLASPMTRAEYDAWLQDARDVYVEQVEMDSESGEPILTTATYDEAAILSATKQYLYGMEGPRRQTWRPPPGYKGWGLKRHPMGELPQYYTWQNSRYKSRREAWRAYRDKGEGALDPAGWAEGHGPHT